MRALCALAVLVIVACHQAQSPPADEQSPSSSQSEASSLSGKWQGSGSGLSVTLDLQQTGNSITGSGTFSFASGGSMGCGGESLPPGGRVSVTGTLTGGEFQGRMTFADTWSPPYTGQFSAPDSLNGHFMSIDRGGCPLPLVRQHQTQ